MDYSIQTFSVRDVLPANLETTLKALGEMGYTHIEYCDFFGKTAEELNAALDAANLKVSGNHINLAKIAEDFEGKTAYNKAIGNNLLIEPMADMSTSEKLDAFVALANDLQPKLEALGFTVAYHNHNVEFIANEDGQIIFDELVSRTNIKLELDTFWAYAGGRDPVAMMEQFKDRLIYIHIKDGISDGKPKPFPKIPQGASEKELIELFKDFPKGVPLGMGTAPVKAVYAKAIELGIPMCVESETLTPDGLSEAKVCIDFLKEQEK
ncbi:MAG: sugar phosphate isomerase/epimerase [Clostridiales bacterium]|jgi:sugar phosphate isomerase/epimerase|nr:sugar phosphate isomerase/epimerase [Clostridiales bacterium]